MVDEREKEGHPSRLHELFILWTMDRRLLSVPTKGNSLPKKESRVGVKWLSRGHVII